MSGFRPEHYESKSTLPAEQNLPAMRRPVRALVMTVAVGLIALLGMEWTADGLSPPQRIGHDNLFMFDAETGFVYLRNHVYPGFEWFDKWIDSPMYTNNRGLKGQKDYPAPKDEDELRVIAFGGSSTNGMHLDSYPEYLERILADALADRDVWVQNAGVNGYSSENVKRLARREIPLFKPDIVIICVGTNDAGLADRHDRVDFQVTSFAEFLARTGQKSATVGWFRRTLPEALIQPYQNVAWRPITTPPETQVPRVTIAQRKENLRAVVEAAREQGAMPIITLYPWLFWNEEENWMPPMADYGPYLQAAREVAVEEGVPLCDLVMKFQRPDRAAFFVVVEEPRSQEFGKRIDNYHLNLPGAELAAAEFARVIRSAFLEENPEMDFPADGIEAVERKWSDPPESVDDYTNMVPPEDLWRHVTPEMQESNERMIEQFPEILGGGESPFLTNDVNGKAFSVFSFLTKSEDDSLSFSNPK